ncbi:MAG: Nif3-like dinuclear metal center hexameric protein [Bradymonadales bacterium]|nr:Nif3-like dinuclear metal center hexameric protein [Bradymonadales bacterium]
MKLTELVSWLDETLQVTAFDDSAYNGLQVEAGHRVDRFAVAVDASLGAIEQASEAKAQLLLCHHGLFWGPQKPLVGPLAEKLRCMFRAGLSLYGAHLPLDAHQTLGNNACLARMLELTEIAPFGLYRGQKIGMMGTLPSRRPTGEVIASLTALLGDIIGDALYGQQEISRVAVVSGAGGDMVQEAVGEGVDLLVSGEVDHTAAVMARDHGFNLAFFGHWATETLGVKALADAIQQRYGLPWVFVGETTGF